MSGPVRCCEHDYPVLPHGDLTRTSTRADTFGMSNGDRAKLFLDRVFPVAMGCLVLLEASRLRDDTPILSIAAVVLALLLFGLAIWGPAWKASRRSPGSGT